MDTQESEVNAQTSHSSEGREATGGPAALFSPKRNTKRGVLCSETLMCRS